MTTQKDVGPFSFAKTGQVWEGADRWVILIVKAGRPSHYEDNWVVHHIRTLSYPDNYNGRDVYTISENARMGGMICSGWTRIA
jgi:hypothetical protein